MPEGLSPQERIELGSDPNLSKDDEPLVVGGDFRELRRQFLQEPYFEASIVRSLVNNEDLGSLIATGYLLAFADHGDSLFPAFQFDPETHLPFSVVVEINHILGSPTDGWGVAGWWTQPNGRLGKDQNNEYIAPKDLLSDPVFHPILIDLADATASPDY